VTLDLRHLPSDVLAAARAGDKAALTAIFTEAAGVVRFFARKRARPGEPLDELISIGNLAVFDALRTYRPGKGQFYGWLCCWLDGRLRTRARGKAFDVASLEDVGVPEASDTTPLPDELLALHDDTLALRRALARLPSNQRTVVRGYLEGLGFAEMAARLGCTRQHASFLFRQGLERLQRELAGGAAAPVAPALTPRRGGRGQPPPKCGTRARYGKGCRCVPCVLANRAYSLRWERNRRSAA